MKYLNKAAAADFVEHRKKIEQDIPHYDLVPSEEGIYETSYVKNPATKQAFLVFNAVIKQEPIKQGKSIRLGSRVIHY